ncbi:MAG: ribosomal protein L29 [Phycisphaerales bacterium]|jgi:ribosomal protein L29
MAYESLNGQRVRAMADDEIVTLVRKFRDELFALKNQSVSEKVEDVMKFEKLRKDIARLKTEQTVRRTQAAAAKA